MSDVDILKQDLQLLFPEVPEEKLERIALEHYFELSTLNMEELEGFVKNEKFLLKN